ncbi:MAG: hypothetical protein FJ112_05265 [Deltaproteobacteria bacterium]|nr:hypothetical protein [Deltaproteobacteria bacterium]
MAKAVKSNGAKSAQKTKKRVVKNNKGVVSASAKVKAVKGAVKAKSGRSAQRAAKSPVLVTSQPKPEKKELSQKLVDTIEKRKQAKESDGKPQGSKFFVKPPGRRGRRPKNLVDYQPENREEDSYIVESERENIEYDTGIRVSERKDESGFGVDRFEDFDEELNFDW